MLKKKPLILIVEDDADIAGFYARLLKHNGYSPLVASTGAGARILADENEPALIAMDMDLPDCDGLSLCDEFHQKYQKPILLIAGKPKNGGGISGRSAAGDRYTASPLNKKEILTAIRSQLRTN